MRFLQTVVMIAVAALPVDFRNEQRQPTANEVLQKAREFLGGPKALDGVSALEIVRTGEAIRVQFPDKYQLVRTNRSGILTTTFDGKALWSNPDVANPDRDSPDILRQKGLRNAAEYGVTFLLRVAPPLQLSPTLGVAADCAGQSSWCLAFEISGKGRVLFVAVDSSTGQPMAVIRPLYDGTADAKSGDGVTLLSDYRSVAGVKLPFSTESRMVNQPGLADRVIGRFKYTEINVNPVFPGDTFKR
jgi:hypothetical protein